jgi:hypothetical protein
LVKTGILLTAGLQYDSCTALTAGCTAFIYKKEKQPQLFYNGKAALHLLQTRFDNENTLF